MFYIHVERLDLDDHIPNLVSADLLGSKVSSPFYVW